MDFRGDGVSGMGESSEEVDARIVSLFLGHPRSGVWVLLFSEGGMVKSGGSSNPWKGLNV